MNKIIKHSINFFVIIFSIISIFGVFIFLINYFKKHRKSFSKKLIKLFNKIKEDEDLPKVLRSLNDELSKSNLDIKKTSNSLIDKFKKGVDNKMPELKTKLKKKSKLSKPNTDKRNRILKSKSYNKTPSFKLNVNELNTRQKEVLNYVKLVKNINMKKINSKFGHITQRTLRRDLNKLEELGFVKQEGRTRNSVYIYI